MLLIYAGLVLLIDAACFGVAQVFKFAIGWPDDQLIADGIFDLFSLGRVSAVAH